MGEEGKISCTSLYEPLTIALGGSQPIKETQFSLLPTPHSPLPCNWQGLEIFQAHNVAPQELVVESLPSHLIVIHTTPQPVEVIERADSLRFRGLAQAGSININSAGSMASCRWSEEISFIRLDVPPKLIEH